MAENAQPITGCTAQRAAPARTKPASRDGTLPATRLGPEGGYCQCFASASGGRPRQQGRLRLPEALPVRRSVCHAVSQSRCQRSRKDSPLCQDPQLPPSVSPSPDFNPKQSVTFRWTTAAYSCSGSHPTEIHHHYHCLIRPPPAIHAVSLSAAASILAFGASCEAPEADNGADNSYAAVSQPAIP